MVRYSILLGVFAIAACSAAADKAATISQQPVYPLIETHKIAQNAERYFAPLAATADISGTLLIKRAGQPAQTQYFGWANWSNRTPHSPETLYSAASVTKSITAATLISLSRDNILSLDDPVGKWIPTLKGYPEMTLRKILQHRAGLPRELPDGFDVTQRTVSAWLAQNPDQISETDKESYSNAGYALLAEVIATADGKSFAEAAKYRVLKPARMNSSSIISGIAGDMPGGAQPYTPGPIALGVMTPMRSGPEIGSSGLVTTAADLARWARVLADGAYPELFEGDDPLGSIDTGSDENGDYVSLQGTLPGYAANAIAWKNGGLSIAYVGNIFSYPALNMKSRLLRLVGNVKPATPTVRPKDVALSPVHQKLSGRYQHPDFGKIAIQRNNGGHMMLTMPGKPAYWSFYLTPISDGRLHWRAFNIIFSIDAEGGIHAGGKMMERIDLDL